MSTAGRTPAVKDVARRNSDVRESLGGTGSRGGNRFVCLVEDAIDAKNAGSLTLARK